MVTCRDRIPTPRSTGRGASRRYTAIVIQASMVCTIPLIDVTQRSLKPCLGAGLPAARAG